MAVPPLPMLRAVPRHRHLLDPQPVRLVGDHPPHVEGPLPIIRTWRREPPPLHDLRPHPIPPRRSSPPGGRRPPPPPDPPPSPSPPPATTAPPAPGSPPLSPATRHGGGRRIWSADAGD